MSSVRGCSSGGVGQSVSSVPLREILWGEGISPLRTGVAAFEICQINSKQ